MRSVKTSISLAISALALLLSVNPVFSDVVWTANIASSPDPAVAGIGGSLEFWLADEKFDITGLPDHECWTHGDQTTEYRWTVNGGAVEGNGSSASVSSGNNGDVGAGEHSISFEGKTGYFICWTDEENKQQSDGPYQFGWHSFGSKGFTVVKVASLSCSEVISTTGTPGLAETVHVAIGEAGSTITLSATSYPPESWPSGTPSWSTSNPDGSSATGQASVNARTDSAGASTIGVSCGTSNAAIILKVIEVDSLEPNIGEEIDDGDENPDTRTFVVAAADTGVVTVTATPNPGVADAVLLPDSWTLTGGVGTGKLSRTIDRTTPGIYELTCTCGTSQKTTKVIVAKVVVKSISPTTYAPVYNGGDVTVTYTILPLNFFAGTNATVDILDKEGTVSHSDKTAPYTGGTHNVNWSDTTTSLRSLNAEKSPYTARVTLAWAAARSGGCSATSDPNAPSGSISAIPSEVSILAENGITECMEGRDVTFSATVQNFVGCSGHDIRYQFIFQKANGTYWTQEHYTTNLYCDGNATADPVPEGNINHFFITPITVTVLDDYTHLKVATPLRMKVWELAITSPASNCHLMKDANFTSGCTHSPDCTNFQWSAPVSWGKAWTLQGDLYSDSGTLKITGDASVTNSAKLKVTCKDGEGNNHKAEIPITVHRLAMMRNGTEITHKSGKSNIEVVIGDKIELAVNVIPTDGAPAIDSWQWTVPGTRVKGFTVTEKSGIDSTGTTDELSEGECQADEVGFHWVDGGNNRVVSCSIIVQSVTLTVDAKFDVEGITSTFTCAIGDVGADEWSGRGDWRLHFGWNPFLPYANGRPEGVEFAYSASSAPAGTFKMRQLVTSVTHKKQMTADGSWKAASGSDYLDTNLFMPDAVDSPCSELLTPAYLNYETSTTFSTWLMYKPNSPGAIFVPLRKIDWFWSGKATRSGATWSLTASDKPSAAPASTETVEFPEWTHNIYNDPPQFQ